MSLTNSSDTYGKISIVLHWLMALMVIGMIFVGFYMDGMPRGPEKVQIVQMHKASGLMVLILALFRWYWTLTNQSVKPLASWSKAETAASHAVKWLLMLCLLVMPLSGWFMSMSGGKTIDFFGLFTIPALIDKNELINDFTHEVHEMGALVIALLVIVHILGAIKHRLIDKDNTLGRMLGKK